MQPMKQMKKRRIRIRNMGKTEGAVRRNREVNKRRRRRSGGSGGSGGGE